MPEIQRPAELVTTRPGLTLRELTVPDAADYHQLVQRNRAHLTRLGDYRDEVAATPAEVAERFGVLDPAAVRFGIRLHGVLIGRTDLVAVDPPRYGLGYWLDAGHTGRGLATLAVGALLRYAEERLDATEVFAGVTHGNSGSVALLHRLGFRRVEDFETYTRFRREFASGGTRAGDPPTPAREFLPAPSGMDGQAVRQEGSDASQPTPPAPQSTM